MLDSKVFESRRYLLIRACTISQIEQQEGICESALAQRRSAQLPKLKKIPNKPRPLSNDFSVLFAS